MTLFLVQTHIDQYKHAAANNRKFKEIEALKVKQFLNYTQYGLYGFRVFFNPSPVSIFFSHSGAFSELVSNIDTGEKMIFYNSIKGKTLFEQNPVGFVDFAGILMLLGSLFVLYTGYESLRHKEYLKFVASLSDYKKVFVSIVVWRAFFCMLFFLFIMAGALLLTKINGVEIPANEMGHLLVYLAVTLLMLLFFFAAGMVGSSFKSRVTGVVTAISLWFALVFFIPWAARAVILKSSETIRPTCHMELEKLTLLMDFEKRAAREVGIFKSGKEAPKPVKDMMESYWRNEFKTIQAVEEMLKNEIKATIRRFEVLSIFFPTTFYLSTTNAVSSKGYENFIDFYGYVQALKQKFLRFYIDKKFYTDHTGVEPFVKKDENIYNAGSRLPGNFGAGIVVMVFYIVGGLAASFFCFKRSLFVLPGKAAKDLNGLDVELKRGETYVLLANGSAVNNQLYNFFSAQAKGFKGMVRLDDAPLAPGPGFIYLCQPDQLPGDLRVGDFTRFVKRLLKVSNKAAAELYIRLGKEHIEDKYFAELPLEQRGNILLATAQLKETAIYMFRDFLKGTAADFMTHFTGELERLKARKAAILYLTDDVLLASKIGDSAGSLGAAPKPKLDAYDLV
jgi:ABC-type transport system involved in multi-copper enzyme maturation permease subunit